MNQRTTVSIKQTKKMKKEGIVTQKITMKIEGTFSVNDHPDDAAIYMGKFADAIIRKTSLLGGYMHGTVSVIKEKSDED